MALALTEHSQAAIYLIAITAWASVWLLSPKDGAAIPAATSLSVNQANPDWAGGVWARSSAPGRPCEAEPLQDHCKTRVAFAGKRLVKALAQLV